MKKNNDNILLLLNNYLPQTFQTYECENEKKVTKP